MSEALREDQKFNDLTDSLFGYLAQIGLRRNSAELARDEGKVNYQQAYDAIISLARKGHEECMSIRNKENEPNETA